MKEVTLLSKLMKEFTSEQIVNMIAAWQSSRTLKEGSHFGFFYTRRHEMFEKCYKDYSWD